MAHLISLPTRADSRGSLTVIEKLLPFEIKRVFYIYGVPDPSVVRGGHRHRKNIQALVSVSGSCVISTDVAGAKGRFVLDSPEKCLILEPRDWHTMGGFTKDCVLLVMASENYDPADYVREPVPAE